MLKIIAKRFSALILSAAIMVSAATVAGYAEEADSKSKITDTLSQKIEEDFFDGEITAVLNIKITDDVTFKTKNHIFLLLGIVFTIILKLLIIFSHFSALFFGVNCIPND